MFMPSRLFIYYNERLLEGSVDSDSGAMIRDGIKAMNRWGVCPEEQWQYGSDNLFKKPDKAAYDHALHHRIKEYLRLENGDLESMRTCLASGFPFVFGFSVYDSFETEEVARTGMMPMPDDSETLQGGHAVLAVGYDDDRELIKVRNSWGEGWGDNGYFYMPYKFITNPDLADDFWTIRFIQKND
jgi:C1A family cysteine protease